MLRFLALCVVTIGALVGVGVAIAALGSAEARDAVAWTLWIGGGLIALVAAGGGSTAENYSDTRQVVGGRFTDSPPLQRAPLQYALLGLLCVAVGVLVFLFA